MYLIKLTPISTKSFKYQKFIYQIDREVYKLYGFTKEEIKIVEGLI